MTLHAAINRIADKWLLAKKPMHLAATVKTREQMLISEKTFATKFVRAHRPLCILHAAELFIRRVFTFPINFFA
jgi:hypothetical protein